ncbi:hypothetical protein [uncultured Methanobrevibacter sp.]|uniref:hypothetical protein n=1 Tax=uncultured Methanobrevibacter sp. TaxID=253161 RepID=UPI0025F7628C|nr:hypothetical protein [uncultured Methanobrevibacter sp.]
MNRIINEWNLNLGSEYIYPKESWLVAELTSTMDKNMILSTNLDALSPAMESYLVKTIR